MSRKFTLTSAESSVRNAHVLGYHHEQAPKYARICGGCRSIISARIFNEKAMVTRRGY